MKKFFMDLLSSNSPLSSKRFAGLLTLLSCIILAFIATFKRNGICPDSMYNGLLFVVAGLFGFNMAESIFKKSDRQETAKEVDTKEVGKTTEAEDKVE